MIDDHLANALDDVARVDRVAFSTCHPHRNDVCSLGDAVGFRSGDTGRMCSVALVVDFFAVEGENEFCTLAEILVVDSILGISYGLSRVEYIQIA